MGKYEDKSRPAWLDLFTGKRRKRAYLALMALGGVAVLYGVMTAEQVEAWGQVLVQVLGVAGLGMAAGNISEDGPR